MNKTILTAESVCQGHPDKLCDFIADSVLDACLEIDKMSRVACEVMATKNKIVVAGEITCNGKLYLKTVVKDALRRAGYNPNFFKIMSYISKQSSDIAGGVDNALESRNGDHSMFSELGAGDQGTVYGFATNETDEMLPLPIVLAHGICRGVDRARRTGNIKGILPDGKAQVSIEYENGKAVRVKNITVSVQHSKNKDLEELREEIISKVLYNVFRNFPYDDNTEILVNPSGRFVVGGTIADTGLTGRKLMVDSYGGLASHGGGAFCGKDSTKVDRSGAYMARYVAKNIVASGLASKCEVAISYAIGKADPVSVSVNTFGTSKLSSGQLSEIVQRVFLLRPAAIIEKLRLRRPCYKSTAVYGHFGKDTYDWEICDKVEELRKVASEYGY